MQVVNLLPNRFFYTCITDTFKLKVLKMSLALQLIDLVLVLLCIIGDT